MLICSIIFYYNVIIYIVIVVLVSLYNIKGIIPFTTFSPFFTTDLICSSVMLIMLQPIFG